VTYARRVFAGAAAQTTIVGAINATSTTITIAGDVGWPSGANEFYVVVDPGQATEEKLLVTRSGTTLTCASTAKRGLDGTAAAGHSNGAVIYPCVTAADLDEANRLVSAYTTRGDVVTVDSAGLFARVAVGTFDQVLRSDGSDVVWGQVGTQGIADGAVTAAKLAVDAYAHPMEVFTQNASYIPNIQDAGSLILMNVSSANNFQIGDDAYELFPVGTVIHVAQIGTGQTTIAPSVGMTIVGTPGLKLRARYSMAHVTKIAANSWLAWGDLAA